MTARDFLTAYMLAGIAVAAYVALKFLEAHKKDWKGLKSPEAQESVEEARWSLDQIRAILPPWACALVLTFVSAAAAAAIVALWPYFVVKNTSPPEEKQ